MSQTTQNEASICALIVTYNRLGLLKECLGKVMAQSYMVAHLIVIDNASSDGTSDWLSSIQLADYPFQFHQVRMERNLGGAGGFRAGLQIAQDVGCDWIWLMDDDCMPSETCLAELVNASRNLPVPPSFLASAVFGPNNEPMNVPVVANSLSPNGYPDWYRYLDHGLIQITSATFVSLLISRDAVRRIGLPIGEFFLWGDDTEYTMRLTRFYANAYLCGKSTVIHKRANANALDIAKETNHYRIQNYRHMVRNDLVIAKYYGSRETLVNKLFHYLGKTCVLLFRGSGGISLRARRALAISRGVQAFVGHRYQIGDLRRLV